MKGKKMIYLEVEKTGDSDYIFYDQSGNAYKWIGRPLTPKDLHEIKYCINTKRCIRLAVSDVDGSLERFGTADYKFFDRASDKDAETCAFLQYFDPDEDIPTLDAKKLQLEENAPVTAKSEIK